MKNRLNNSRKHCLGLRRIYVESVLSTVAYIGDSTRTRTTQIFLERFLTGWSEKCCYKVFNHWNKIYETLSHRNISLDFHCLHLSGKNSPGIRHRHKLTTWSSKCVFFVWPRCILRPVGLVCMRKWKNIFAAAIALDIRWMCFPIFVHFTYFLQEILCVFCHFLNFQHGAILSLESWMLLQQHMQR